MGFKTLSWRKLPRVFGICVKSSTRQKEYGSCGDNVSVRNMNSAFLLLFASFLPQSDQSSFVVGISFRFDASASPFCAGTLIAKRWVVTSASCVFSDRFSYTLCLTVMGLVVNRKVMKEGKLAVGFGEDGKQDLARVAKVIAHKRYVVDIKKRDFSRKRNIALLELESDVDGTKYKSACILGKARKRSYKATFWDLLTAKNLEFKAPQKYSLFGWQLDPLLPGALSDKIQEKQGLPCSALHSWQRSKTIALEILPSGKAWLLQGTRQQKTVYQFGLMWGGLWWSSYRGGEHSDRSFKNRRVPNKML